MKNVDPYVLVPLLDAPTKNGHTCLMLAAINDYTEMLDLLCLHGANPLVNTKHGTAKDLAKSFTAKSFLEKQYQIYAELNQNKTDTPPIDPKNDVSSDNNLLSTPENLLSSSSDKNQKKGFFGTPKSNQSSTSSSSSKRKKIFTSENCPLDLDFVSPSVLGGSSLGMCMCPGRTKVKK